MVESSSPAVPRSDAELIAALAQGDEAAYATIRERHVAAARTLASQVADGRAEAVEVVSETFARLHDVLRRGDGPTEAFRPYLLTAVRRVAFERQKQRAGASAAAAPTGSAEAEGPAAEGEPASPAEGVQIPNLGEPLYLDPAAAELESAPLAHSYMSLLERQRAILWHTVIEQADPADAAVLLGVAPDGLAALREQSCLALYRAYLKLNLSDLTPQDCREAVAPLAEHLAGVASAADQSMVELHLRACRDCRAAAVKLGSLTASLRRAVAPIFLGPAADAYLAATEAKAASASQIIGGLRWMRQAPRRMTQAPRQRQALVAGAVLVAAFGITGLSLTLAASTGPRHTTEPPVAAAIQPPEPTTFAPSSPPGPAPSRPATARPGKRETPAPSSPAPQSPGPASASPPPKPAPSPSPSPTTPSPAPSPPPARPSPPPHHHHHRPPST